MDARDDGQHTYRSRRRQLLIAASMVLIYLATFSIIFEPDPTTHTKPVPSDYLWQVIPFALLTLWLAWRSFKVRLVTTAVGLWAYRVAGHETLPWSTIRGFEIHPNPSGRTVAVVARRTNGRTVRLMSFWLRKKDGGRSPAADELLEALSADRDARVQRLTQPAVAGAR